MGFLDSLPAFAYIFDDFLNFGAALAR